MTLSPDKKKDLVLWAVVAVLCVAFFFILVQRLGALSLWMDEGFHYLAAEGILSHGYPLFPSGHVYYKAILYTYALALSCLIFGLNAFGLRLVSVLAFVGLLPVAFLFAKRLFGRAAGLLAAIGLAFSAWQMEIGRLALYFLPVQVFYIACLYAFYRGYFEEDKRWRRAAFILFLLIPHVHQLGLGVWFCFPAFLLLRGARRFFRKDVLVPFFVISLANAALQLHEFFFWKVGYVYERTDTNFKGMIDYFFSGFSLGYFKELGRSFPKMSLIVFGGLFLCLGARLFRTRSDDSPGPDSRNVAAGQAWLFANLCLVFPLLFLGFFRTHIQPRYLLQLYPLFFILFAGALLALAKSAVDLLIDPFVRLRSGIRRDVPTWIVLGLLTVGLGDGIGPGIVRTVAGRGYRDPIKTDIITRSGRFSHYDHRGIGSFVRRFLASDDIVIAVHVVFGYIYAGRVDYWLWTGGPGTWDAWEKTSEGWKDFYVGARWINTLDDLKKIVENNPGKRVWLIASPSLDNPAHIRQEVADFVRSDPGRLVFRGRDGMSEVYLWHDAKGEFAGPSRTLEAECIPEPPGRIVFAPDASRQAALLLDKKKMRRPAAFAAGLPNPLPAGRYELVIRCKTDEVGILEKILGVSLQAGKEKTEVRAFAVAGSDFEGPGLYKEFSWDFFLKREEPLILKFLFTGRAALTVDYLDIKPIAAEEEGGVR
ncbi:MAG: glycosyltransferase family 39 protein [Candidatus Aminicenantes bacterium]|nr:glycosyltransferase family 39 protein [Candidatus Aminicenantes bacterium]